MVSLRSLAWPHLVPARPPPAAHSTPNPKASSVREAVDQMESTAKDIPHVRRSSFGDQPRVPLIRTLPSRPELHSRASSPAVTVTSTAPSSNSPAGLTQNGGASYAEACENLSNQGQFSGSLLSPPLPPSVAHVDLNSQADLENLPSLPETSSLDSSSQLLGMRFVDDLDRRMSDVLAAERHNLLFHDTNLRTSLDSLEAPKVEVLAPSPSRFSEDEDPGMLSPGSGFLDPTGHFVSVTSKMPGFWSRGPEEALPLSRARRPRPSRAASYDGADNPRVAIVLPTPPSSGEDGEPISPTSGSKHLMGPADDYFGPTLSAVKTNSSDESPSIMYTAPQTPIGVPSSLLPSNYSFNGPGINPGSSRPSIKDFALLHSSPAVLTRLRVLSPFASNLESRENMVPIHENGHEQATPSFDGVSSGPELPTTTSTTSEILSASGDPEVEKILQIPFQLPAADSAELSGMSAIPPATGSIPSPAVPIDPEVPQVPKTTEEAIPAVPQVTGGASNVPEIPGVPALTVPVVPIPPTPERKEKQKPGTKIKNICKKIIRRCRTIMLKEPVLGVCLGRQLAKPTAVALKQISNGLPLEPIADAAGAAPVPIPA